MTQVKKLILGALLFTAIGATAQDTTPKNDAKKVKDSVKTDVRYLGKATTTTTTTTRKVGYRRKIKDQSAQQPVTDATIVKDTVTAKGKPTVKKSI